jgi:hypothetical protein
MTIPRARFSSPRHVFASCAPGRGLHFGGHDVIARRSLPPNVLDPKFDAICNPIPNGNERIHFVNGSGSGVGGVALAGEKTYQVTGRVVEKSKDHERAGGRGYIDVQAGKQRLQHEQNR